MMCSVHFLGLEARPDAGCGSNLLGQVVDGVAEMVGAEMCHVLGEGGDLHDWTTRIKMVEKNYVFPLLCKNGAGQTYLDWAGAGDIGQLLGRHGDTGADQDQQLCGGKIGRKMLGYVHFVKLQ